MCCQMNETCLEKQSAVLLHLHGFIDLFIMKLTEALNTIPVEDRRLNWGKHICKLDIVKKAGLQERVVQTTTEALERWVEMVQQCMALWTTMIALVHGVLLLCAKHHAPMDSSVHTVIPKVFMRLHLVSSRFLSFQAAT